MGCSSEGPKLPVEPETKPVANGDGIVPENPVEKKDELYEQLHGGMFAIGAAVEKVGNALDLAKRMEGKAAAEDKEALKDLIAVLDDTGASLADYGGEGPTEDEVKGDRKKYTAKRLNLIELLNETLRDLREQEGVAAGMEQMTAEPLKSQAGKLNKLMGEIVDDLVGALEEMGAKEEHSQDLPDTGDTNQPIPPGYTTGG